MIGVNALTFLLLASHTSVASFVPSLSSSPCRASNYDSRQNPPPPAPRSTTVTPTSTLRNKGCECSKFSLHMTTNDESASNGSSKSKSKTSMSIEAVDGPKYWDEPDNEVKLLRIKSLDGTVARIKHENFPNSWIVRLSEDDNAFIMIDVPKFSEDLKRKILEFCGGQSPMAIAVTNRNSIYYGDAPGGLIIRKSDLILWADAFPGIEVVMNRHDINRDLQKVVTQRLDGYGPWGIDLKTAKFNDLRNPLEEIDGLDEYEMILDVENYVSPELEEVDVRNNELSKYCIAAYTPGHTFGSMCYVVPELRLVLSGNTLPPTSLLQGKKLRMDAQGIVTTNRAGVRRQADSARTFVQEYGDIIDMMLPSRGLVQRFPSPNDKSRRVQFLMQLLDEFETYEGYENMAASN